MGMRNAVITKHLNIEKVIESLNLFSLITQDTGILERSSLPPLRPSPPPPSSPHPLPLLHFYLPFPFLILIFIV